VDVVSWGGSTNGGWNGGIRIAADLGSFMGLGEGVAAHAPMPPSPFRLPQAYEDAKEKKVAAVAELRNAVKSVRSPPKLHFC
jgi:hypothetical protein